jgi:hypothetical protein
MTKFENIKSDFAAKCKLENACSGEFRKLLASKNEKELLEVIYNNLIWCISNEVISHEFFSQFDPQTFLDSGIANTGKENTGYVNSGDRNSGDSNSGDSNSGYRNSGNWNSGDRNSGDSNSGYRNSGAFCTDNNPPLILFNKVSKMTVKEWENSEACQLMYSIDPTIWVPMSMMTDEEKKAYPKYETTEGYLKTIPMKEAWANFWHNLSDSKKKLFTSLENFDPEIFEEITGIKI